jgi:4a-hydroxytetrahydrobiopterin dehydratase
MGNGSCDLTARKCVPCEGGVPPLSQERIDELLKELAGWEYNDGKISRTFSFKDFYETVEFVNAIAWIANREGHHPDLEVSYNTCNVSFRTHAINGMSENDFICAAKIDALFK